MFLIDWVFPSYLRTKISNHKPNGLNGLNNTQSQPVAAFCAIKAPYAVQAYLVVSEGSTIRMSTILRL